ncbi:MAG: hypothetical protein CSB24_04775 [Deltaproteobacteria bacterium]|nr:MAG: hypothetical protein CSB24_04775 [Deltaproteobacteria bacterium]
MMPVNSILYALVGAALVYLFQHRRQQLGKLDHENFPELDDEDYQQLVTLVKMAYERILYLGVMFFPLAWAARPEGERVAQYFFLILIFLLFIANIIPRNRIMKLLEKNGLDIKTVNERGVVI